MRKQGLWMVETLSTLRCVAFPLRDVVQWGSEGRSWGAAAVA